MPLSFDKDTRRGFIFASAGAFVGTGLALAAWPFIDQMNPSADVAPPDAMEFDLSTLAPGHTVRVTYKNVPLFIRRRMPEEMARAQSAPLDQLRDRVARNAVLDPKAAATDANRVSAKDPSYLVVEAVCPHDRCVLQSYELADRIADGIGFVCPCDASRFDLSGRAIYGPAQTNLPVPRFTVLSPIRLRLG